MPSAVGDVARPPASHLVDDPGPELIGRLDGWRQSVDRFLQLGCLATAPVTARQVTADPLLLGNVERSQGVRTEQRCPVLVIC